MLTLGENGEVDVTTVGDPPVHAKLDSKGCLVGADGLWAELTPGGVLWTPHELFLVEGETIRLPEGAMGVRPDGTVERIRADGSVDAGFLSFEGYRDDARCAAKLLLVTFMAMMPSMAVSDGHPAMAPIPADSLCSQYRRAGTG